MSGIVLSASVRQNLLSLQSTADLLATTQNRLSTGKKVNTALDNPTNYLHRQLRSMRAPADINNLLDGIGNGVQVLQAANTGITSLQKLVDSAKSVANQALQTTVGFSTKSSFHVRRDRWRNGRQSRRRSGFDQRRDSPVLLLRQRRRIHQHDAGCPGGQLCSGRPLNATGFVACCRPDLTGNVPQAVAAADRR